jgi:hypothetical protein
MTAPEQLGLTLGGVTVRSRSSCRGVECRRGLVVCS